MSSDELSVTAVNTHKYQDQLIRMRMRPANVVSVSVTSQGWILVRFADKGLEIVGMLPTAFAWLAGVRCEVLGYSTEMVDKRADEKEKTRKTYRLHLRIKPISEDPHAIGHAYHENPPLLQKPAGNT